MLRASKALIQNAKSSPKMPHIEALRPLYDLNVHPRIGQVFMIAGRSGAMKSTFALWLTESWGLDTLYFSADMTAFQASMKLASLRTQKDLDTIESDIRKGDGRQYIDALEGTKVQFSFHTPIRWNRVVDEINAWVVAHNRFPQVIVLDNLMDIEGAESDYSEQMFAMQAVSDLSRETGATVLILHHASDKSQDATYRPFRPPSRKEVKGGLSEKPEMSLGIAFNPNTMEFHVSPIKNRLGFQDPTANTFATLGVTPETNTFYDRGAYEADLTVATTEGIDNGS